MNDPINPFGKSYIFNAAKDECNWMLFGVFDEKGKTAKQPADPKSGKHPLGAEAVATLTYYEALAAMDALNDAIEAGKATGYRASKYTMGYLSRDDSELVCVDIDNGFGKDGKLRPWAARLLSGHDIYVELSPSGEGVHVIMPRERHRSHEFWKGFSEMTVEVMPDGEKNQAIEIFCSASRGWTITGDVWNGMGTLNSSVKFCDALEKFTDSHSQTQSRGAAGAARLTVVTGNGDSWVEGLSSERQEAAIRSALATIPSLDRDAWIAVGNSLAHFKIKNGAEWVDDVWEWWSTEIAGGTYNPGTDALSNRCQKPNGKRHIGSLFHDASTHHGWNEREFRPGGKAKPASNVQPIVTVVADPIATAEIGNRDAPSGDIDERFGIDRAVMVLNKNDAPVWCMESACQMLRYHPDWYEALAYNEFTYNEMVLRRVPGSNEALKDFKPRAVDDVDYTYTEAWFNRHGFPNASKRIAKDAITLVAHETVISPVKHYLQGLEWDREERLSSLLVDMFGVADSPYARAVARIFLISAVARALDPGCKVDTMLILEGEQGFMKSTAIRKLVPDEDWFGDQLPPVTAKDGVAASEYLPGHLLVEIGELDAIGNKRATDAIKAFITRQSEVYRAAYKANVGRQPRRCVFVGTTNKSNYLNDETGNRRYLPVEVGAIDIAAIVANRDQLWAEAVVAYEADEKWWLEGDLEADAKSRQAERMEHDPWEDHICEYLVGKTEVSVAEIMEGELHIMRDRQHRTEMIRVTNILSIHGWRVDKVKPRFTSGAKKGRKRYVPRSAVNE